MLDVGQGEALLLRDGRRAILVDGGGWPQGDLGSRVLVPALAARGVRRLDALVMTHPDRDHCRGLVDLVRQLPVAEVWSSPGWTPPCAVELISAPGPRWRPLWAGDERRLGRWRLAVLHPPPAASRRRHGGDNDRSLVLAASVHGRRVLLTGDLEAAGERRLLRASREALAADVLKVAHHGSKTSSTAAFLRAVAPRLALISAGRHNPYGHPAAPVLARLEGAGIRVLRTDRGGAVELTIPAGGPLRIRRPGP
ncbi:MAG: MBL fold metallo-hydrolase [Acidobacteria bacterium]|nr:MAG: MBL fold metallo-hydrolase [Acidobacteriota bacterium]